LTIASAKGDAQVAWTLLRAGADPNVQDIYGYTPLARAIAEHHVAVVGTVLDTGAVDLDVRTELGMTPLHLAALVGSPDMARLLLLHGASVIAVDGEGRTPAVLAGAAGHPGVARLIESQGRRTR
jgi:ankyrin repeat protein